ncbi:MAG: GNAT family N-acetyltransferase [Lachnospiraceae bacterium]|nr:GNAT family N-acetyltransferase [Lachnospiraceae bacterium]
MSSKINDLAKVKDLFADWEETMIWSCLQGVMGEIYADDAEHPKSAVAIIGVFAFFAGEPNRELVLYKPKGYPGDFVIMVPQTDAWNAVIEECYPNSTKKVERYALKKEPEVFDKGKLQQMADGLPEEYELKLLDEAVFAETKKADWCADWTAQYSDYETYKKFGLGVVIFKNGQLVSGAFSYTSYENGIEIQVDTKEECRRKGLASACSAKLILECLKRGLYPSWDAQNKGSLALAERLGYHYSHTYTAYEVCGYGRDLPYKS